MRVEIKPCSKPLDDGKMLYYVKVTLIGETLAPNGKPYTYDVRFDEKTRKRFNNYARSLGYTIGVTDKVCSDLSADRSPSVSTDD